MNDKIQTSAVHSYRPSIHIARLFLTIIFLVSALFTGRAEAMTSLDQQTPANPAAAALPAALLTENLSPSESEFTQDNETIYLAHLTKRFPTPPSIFGVETDHLGSTGIQSKASQGNVYFIRRAGFLWSEIEPELTSPRSFNWDAIDNEALEQASAQGFSVIAVIRSTPTWAQKYSGVYCGPVKQDNFDEFAGFVQELVARYSAPPYNIKYWEIGNEPDVDRSLVLPDSPFGCWGENQYLPNGQPNPAWDGYYGGRYYAKMLQQVYPAIKAADPNAKVLNGGLLLSCDFQLPPPDTDCTPSKFFLGILIENRAAYLDIVSYHGYTYFYQNKIYEDDYQWGHRGEGGSVMGKADFLRDWMGNYGVSKPLLLSETSMVCPHWSDCTENPGSPEFFDAQADFVVWAYIRAWANNFAGAIWYTIEGPGWADCGLMESGYVPRPAYYAYQYMTNKLSIAQYTGVMNQYASQNVAGYAFSNNGVTIWVLWSKEQVDKVITLPANVIQVTDKFGAIITPVGGQITVNKPVYVELSP
ncbi:MAG: hypothetical protein JXB15_10790 [Anaerolineales bacterium]|nr:hypothetical protein [Anaerolineales bacterium]